MSCCCWVYLESEPGCFTVGFYSPDGAWNPVSDHGSRDSAEEKVSYLNGAGQFRGGES